MSCSVVIQFGDMTMAVRVLRAEKGNCTKKLVLLYYPRIWKVHNIVRTRIVFNPLRDANRQPPGCGSKNNNRSAIRMKGVCGDRKLVLRHCVVIPTIFSAPFLRGHGILRLL